MMLYLLTVSPRTGQRLPKLTIKLVEGITQIVCEGADHPWFVTEGRAVEVEFTAESDAATLKIERVAT